MLRLRLILVVTVVLIGVAFGMTRVLEGLRAKAEVALQAELMRADRAYLALQRSSQIELRGHAIELARSELVAWLGAVQEHAEELVAVEAEVYRAVPGEVGDERKAAERATWVSTNKASLVDEIAAEVGDRLDALLGVAAWRDRPRAEVVAEARKMLVLCNAVGVNNCLFRFSHYPLRERLLALRAGIEPGVGVELDVVAVVDARGTGIADADLGSWSNVHHFAEQVPAVADALRTRAVVRDIGRLPGHEGWFELAVAPLVEGSTLRGAVLVASELDTARLLAEREHVGFEIGWLVGGELALTTLDKDQAATFVAELAASRDATRHELLLGESYLAALIPLGGQVGTAGVRLAVIAPHDHGTAGLDEAIAWAWGFVLLGGVFALIAVLVILHRFFAPLRVIDARLHEIIQGGRPVELPTDGPEETWATMGQALNAAQAALLGGEERDPEGRPEPAERWAQRLLEDGDRPRGP